MLERFLKQTTFKDNEDYKRNLQFTVPENFNFAYDVMDRWAEEAPNDVALLWARESGEHKKFTFREIKEQTDQVAGYFVSLGIQRDDMVMVILKRRYEFWLTVLALHKIGAIVIPATHMLTARDIVYRNNKAETKAIICVGDDYVVEQIAQAMPESPSVKVLVSVGPVVPEGFHDWHKEVGQAKPYVRPDFVNTNWDIMLAYFTSGTNGEPKMVGHDFTYPIGHIVTGAFWHNLHRGSIHFTVADTGWGKAAWGKLYGQWFVGATVFVLDQERFHAQRLLQAIEKYKITSFCAPPTVYRYLVHEDIAGYDLSSLEWCTTAGEALNPSVFERFKAATGLELHEGFGQTETTMTLGTMPWVKPKPGSMGLPNPQYDIVLLRRDGTLCDDNENGEICVRTEIKGNELRAKKCNPQTFKPIGLFREYFGDPELTKQVWHDGIYHTGDVAYRDEDGYYWFVGRTDDVIKSSGYRIGPFEVESALMCHPAVVECAITGVPDEFRGMVVKATIVLRPDWKQRAGDELIKELQEHVKRTTAPYKYPRIIDFVDALPKTISGKIRRVEIREQDANERNKH